jgi:hypothetical protein
MPDLGTNRQPTKESIQMKSITINGEAFEVSTPYGAGHQVTEIEAKVLNQTRAENIGNNFRKAVKDAMDKGENLDAIRAQIVEYDAAYAFAAGGIARTPIDPIEKEARAIALNAIKAKLKKAGKDVKALPEGKLEELIDTVSQQPEVLKLAKERVKSKQKVADLDLAGLDS